MATWDRYKNTKSTALEVQVQIGGVWKVRFYCDDNSFQALPDNLKPYLRKAPVCKLAVSPIVCLLGESVSWDVSESVSPSNSLDSFNVWFNGSPTDLTAQDWSSDPKSGTVTYDAVGSYIIEANVTDQLGVVSQTASVEVQVVAGPANRAYIGTTDAGVFILDPGGSPTAANSGLSSGHLNLRSLRLHPAYTSLPQAQQHLWACTEDGLAYSTDGAGTWTAIAKSALGTPENAAGDSPAPATADLDQIDLWFDPQDVGRVYVLRTTATRAWLYVTDDYGATWVNEQIGVV